MSVDIEAIRKRIESVGSKSNATSNFKRWKYEKPGKYAIRVLPFRNTEPGVPFPEFQVYYGISDNGKGMIVSPENDGERDPIKEYRIDLYNRSKKAKDSTEADELKQMAKKLSSKTATCVAIIDRSKEEEGPMLWNPNVTDSNELISLFLTDAEDYTDLKNGRDLTIIVSASNKINPKTGKPLLDAKISANFKQTPAHADEKKVEEWMNNMPNLKEYFPVTSTEETERRFKGWLSAGTSQEDSSSDKKEEKEEVRSKKPQATSSAKKKVSTVDAFEDDLDEALKDLDTFED